MTSLCIRCGEWKQVPMSRCACGYRPEAGSDDAAKSEILTAQFRSPEALEEAARLIRSGVAPTFDEGELRIARTIRCWYGAVNLSFLAAAVLFGLLIAMLALRVSGRLHDLPVAVLAITGVLFVIAAAAAFTLMGRMDRMTRRPG